jgi:ectoine hydroxylase-related dioxygenase (phytanoyl-CoA dioxygenase family)
MSVGKLRDLRSAGLRLSDAQVAAFHRDGFIAIDALTDLAEVEELRALYDEMFRRASGFAAGDRIDLLSDAGRALLPQIMNPERYAPRLVQGLAYRNATVIARQLLGEGCESMGNHAILKPAGLGAATPWHQDEAYWDPRHAHQALSIWMPLQPATLANGCMQFIPGSHRRDVLPHELIAAHSHGLRIVESGTPGEETACEIPAAGATIHAGRTLHYAGPNLTDQPRRAVVYGFRLPPVVLPVPKHYPWQRPEWFIQEGMT